MIARAVVASKNIDKVAEIESVLSELGLVGEIVRDAEWEDVVEDGGTLEENALLKARAVMSTTGLAAIADDTGLEVEALEGAPGVHTARFSGPDATYESNVAALLDAMHGVSNRGATFRTVVVLCEPDGTEVVVEGSLVGHIAEAARGSNGFGYDPIFEVDGVTVAQMSSAQKAAISHRALAIRALAAALQSR
ncbi:MAG TPA: RdgB/HAM1 family non-canonical purine NTP pyrophosphatase [Actinobacteria bacterium]|nr:RdgB/HAM1 family non-canonical purine NTP pyrophosphatase [Actinomycetota bacterium]